MKGGTELTGFVALYRGDTVSAAKIIAVSANPELVENFAMRMLADPSEQESVMIWTILRRSPRGRRTSMRVGRVWGGR